MARTKAVGMTNMGSPLISFRFYAVYAGLTVRQLINAMLLIKSPKVDASNIQYVQDLQLERTKNCSGFHEHPDSLEKADCPTPLPEGEGTAK